MNGSSSCGAVTATLVPPTSGTYQTISCGGKRAGHFCCAIDKAGSTTCFGAGSSTYTPASSTYPSDKMNTLSCGTDFCCGLTDQAKLNCFGNLDQSDASSGTDIPSSLAGPFVQVSSGNFATYVLHQDSTVSAYGRVFNKAVGPVPAETSTIDLPYTKGWTSLPTNSGFGHGCAALYKTADTQEVKCWGADYGGQVSDAPNSIMADAFIYPVFQSVLTQSEPGNSSAEAAIKVGASVTFTSIFLLAIYA